jgi:RimJ/RimL family protein N-acetyltransferase
MDKPLHVLRGARVYLRPSERADVPTFVRWFGDARVTETLKPRAPMSLASEERWIESAIERHGRDQYHFVICLQVDDRAIGVIGLHDIEWHNGSAEVGIAIGEPALWDQGLGTEAMGVLLDFGFGELRLERIELLVYAFNPRARRSYLKLGFAHEGTLRRALYRHGAFHDVDLMAILRDEWIAREGPRTWEQP